MLKNFKQLNLNNFIQVV